MKKVSIFEPDNQQWICSMHCGSAHSEFYSIGCKSLCIGPGVPGTEFSGIFNFTNRKK